MDWGVPGEEESAGLSQSNQSAKGNLVAKKAFFVPRLKKGTTSSTATSSNG